MGSNDDRIAAEQSVKFTEMISSSGIPNEYWLRISEICAASFADGLAIGGRMYREELEMAMNRDASRN